MDVGGVPRKDTNPRIERTRRRVIEISAAILQEEGPESLTHARVAQRAEVGRATLYRHWPTREDLILDAMTAVTLSISAPEDLPLNESLVAFMECLQRQLESPVGLAFGSLVERAGRDPRARAVLDALISDAAGQLRRLLHRAKQEDNLVPDQPFDEIMAELAGPCYIERYIMRRRSTRKELALRVEGLLQRWRVNRANLVDGR
jgi:AcrR family transcriptional regulator